MVLLRFRRDAAKQDIERVFAGIAAMKGKTPGLLTYAGGPYSSGEGLNKGFTHGFCMSFTDAKARDAYLVHPEHERVKKDVLALLDGGLDGVVAFDFAS
jgi:hypothetical protein